jgi:serine/threonine protein kinase
VNPPRCRLVDMDSHNGTHVNGRRVAVAELKHGDKIRAGRNVLRVEVQGAAAGESPTLVEPAAALPGPLPLPPAAAVTPPPLPPTELHHAPFVAPAPPLPATLGAAAPPTLGGYRLRKKLGQGAMGVVYLAEGGDGRPVALKMIRPAVRVRRREVERFLREAAILRELQHPHIVRFREVGEHEGTLYLVMDYVPGPNAAALVKRDGPLALERAVALTCQLLEALEYAHARRFVHRDIKPGNLLVYEEGGRELVKLADFGLARVYQASKFSGLTMTGDIGGTPLFMAPEQIVNFRDSPPAADQYSAAATLYYLLTGRPTYDAPKDLYRTFAMILNEDPVPILRRRPDLPVGLAEVVHRGVRRDPRQRFADVAQMRKMLSGFL